MSRLAQERQGGPLVSHLTLRILQASQALRSLVLLVSMETMTQWGLFHASGHDQGNILEANRGKEETSIIRRIECLDRERSGETGVRLKGSRVLPQRLFGSPAGEMRKRG